MTCTVVRLSNIDDDALALLREYYEAVDVQVRDTPDEVQRIIEDPDAGMWIAYVNGDAVGCVCLRALPHLHRAAECKRLYVRPKARGIGIAQALLDAQEAFARDRAFEQIYLDSKDDLEDAIALYRRRGFILCDRYNDNPQATIFMVKGLRAAGRSSTGGRLGESRV